MTDPILEISDLSISYFSRAGEIPAVVDFNLSLNQGESIGLVGESGCGKSTVAMAIMQYLNGNARIVGGSIKFKGRDLTRLSARELQQVRGNEIAMIYQEPMASLNPTLLIGEQLTEVLHCHQKIGRKEARAQVLEMLEKVHLPDPARVMQAYPHQISGGQQQRVVIAMALLSKPALLILDEPTTALDVTVEAGIVELIDEIATKFNTSMIYISHNLGLILETCSRVNVMYSGQVVEVGEVGNVFDEMKHPYTKGLFDCIPLPTTDKHSRPLKPIRGQLPLPHQRPPGCFYGPRCDHFQAGRCDQTEIQISPLPHQPDHQVRCIRSEEVDLRAPLTTVPPTANSISEQGAELLQVKDMQKHYEVNDDSLMALLKGKSVKVVKANEKISFNAHAGETVAIVGESGCGKSTFAKVLMGLETASSGEVRLNGEDIADKHVTERRPDQTAAMQMVFQNPFDTLNPSLSIGTQLARVIKKFGTVQGKAAVQARVLELLDLVKLPAEFAHRKPRQLSGGQKQRIGIARAFAGNPSVVVADEPVSALDVSVGAAVTRLLMSIQQQQQTSVIFISHDLSLVRYLADRVVVIYLGNIVEQGSTEQVFSPPYHPYTEALISAIPVADTSVEKKRVILQGEIPSAMNPPAGCPFSSRCPRKIGSICDEQKPELTSIPGGHKIACHIPLAELQEVEPVFALHQTGSQPPSVAAHPRRENATA
ncbi:dipeptide ABC transporter ATP-binding protein [Marinobacterium rhizophilum]|uniref:ABC transporter ATP-binding protein n=1 Tax=Marinobacterium rhizophilum TaxID=420402 RepID=A0ABY5HID9_9GAMM|nr:ABC transporter ATP-binding protein [Marinobacterium rhizophilum]UTW11859.1 ABC transporter ATP-binding protein [Marinobacterium rhizophilum]